MFFIVICPDDDTLFFEGLISAADASLSKKMVPSDCLYRSFGAGLCRRRDRVGSGLECAYFLLIRCFGGGFLVSRIGCTSKATQHH